VVCQGTCVRIRKCVDFWNLGIYPILLLFLLLYIPTLTLPPGFRTPWILPAPPAFVNRSYAGGSWWSLVRTRTKVIRTESDYDLFFSGRVPTGERCL
jgi:hypothetical protein